MRAIKDLPKPARPVRVIQFGEGGFLRGFVDWMLQKMNDAGVFDGSVAVVQPIREGLCDLLASQNGNYTHIIRGAEGMDQTLVDVISGCVKPYEDFEGFLALADNPDARFVVSNTTEAGICFNAADPFDGFDAITYPAKLIEAGVCTQEDIDAITQAFAAMPALYIADGHHRYETALNFARANSKDLKDDSERTNYCMMFLINMDNGGLVVFPTHRVLHSLENFDASELLERCRGDFEILENQQANVKVEDGVQLAVAGDSADAWSGVRYRQLSRYMANNYVSFAIDRDENWEKGDVYEWRMKRISGNSPLLWTLAVDYADGSSEYVNASKNKERSS